MHRKLSLAVAAVIALAVAGCGGGGGGSAITPPPVSSSIAGTWSVPTLGLPQNQMMITSSGVVYVNGENPTLGVSGSRDLGYYTNIGTCSPDGYMTLDGDWTYGGVYHRITGSGRVYTSSRTVTLTVTLIRDSRLVMQDSSLSGSLLDDDPPPVPDFDNGGGDSGGIDLPPPPPI